MSCKEMLGIGIMDGEIRDKLRGNTGSTEGFLSLSSQNWDQTKLNSFSLREKFSLVSLNLNWAWDGLPLSAFLLVIIFGICIANCALPNIL